MKLKEPIFKDVPKTDAANVNDNIDNWISRGMNQMIEKFLRPYEQGYKGYRFINSSDLTETVEVEEKYKGVCFFMVYERHYKPYGSLDPLYFVHCHTRVKYKMNGKEYPFESKVEIERRIKTQNY